MAKYKIKNLFSDAWCGYGETGSIWKSKIKAYLWLLENIVFYNEHCEDANEKEELLNINHFLIIRVEKNKSHKL